ncbi:hypothetical protein FRB99_002338 [Tulasnella sp. 403]|nr:hypothetical protein FRB99_002338 [Tulasnella sp. 403]
MAGTPILSFEILSTIARHLYYSSTTSLDGLAAFALASKALTRASDPFRMRSLHVVGGISELFFCCQTLLSDWRDVGGVVRELTILVQPSKGKGREDGSSAVQHVSPDETPTALFSPDATTRLLSRALGRTRSLTRLDLAICSDSGLVAGALDYVLPSVATRSLLYLSLDVPNPLQSTVLATFLSSQPYLSHLELPRQTQPYPPESSPPPTPPPNAYHAVGDGRRKRLRLSLTPSAPACPSPSMYPGTGNKNAHHQHDHSAPHLSRLENIRAPVSFLLGLPPQCPLQAITISDRDVPRRVQRRLFEKLAQHGAVSGAKLLHLDVRMEEHSMGLGLMQEITRNLRDIETLIIRGVVRDAYFTYFLQDLAGCISRCRNLQTMTFRLPDDAEGVDHHTPQPHCAYDSAPNSDPSIPLPALLFPHRSHPSTMVPGYGGEVPPSGLPPRRPHVYPPNGPDVFRREQYIVNLYGRTNPCLREVTMPGGTTWRWVPGEIDGSPSSASTATLSDDDHFAFPPLLTTPQLPLGDLSLPPLPEALKVQDKPKLRTPSPIVVPSSPMPLRDRHNSRSIPGTHVRHPHSPSAAWGWEPDPSCVEARAWWEQCGLKPFHLASPVGSTDETEVGDDAFDLTDGETDIECDEEEEPDHFTFNMRIPASAFAKVPVPSFPSEALEAPSFIVPTCPVPRQMLKRRPFCD